MTEKPHANAPILLACLCAEWCDACRGYRAVFETVLSHYASTALSPVWIDIEEHDDVLGSIEIENFPTLLIAREGEALFFGTVTPHAQTLTRLLKSAEDGTLRAVHDGAEAHNLVARIQTMQADL